ncbi:hypothetical protein [Amycolatopsis sp. La24]|uniref:hypothetical protein n=1 Tax=Amycolatopsis sp. La24 TaxID=3028304 RepID=UPI0023AEF04D|nr:hypothetical protein [Amycolatopsis sp. La24]
MSQWLLGIPSVVLIGGYAYWYFRNYRKRRDQYAAAAAEHGWAYQERDRDLLGRCHGYPFNDGRRPRAWHVVTGTNGDREFTSFEYSAVFGHDDAESSDRAERQFTQVFALQLPGAAPDLTVRPRGMLGQLAHGLKTSSSGSSDFDRSWAVDGAPADLSPQVRSWVTTHRRPFRLVAGQLWTWADGRMDLARIEPALNDLHQLADALSRQLPPPASASGGHHA